MYIDKQLRKAGVNYYVFNRLQNSNIACEWNKTTYVKNKTESGLDFSLGLALNFSLVKSILTT